VVAGSRHDSTRGACGQARVGHAREGSNPVVAVALPHLAEGGRVWRRVGAGDLAVRQGGLHPRQPALARVEAGLVEVGVVHHYSAGELQVRVSITGELHRGDFLSLKEVSVAFVPGCGKLRVFAHLACVCHSSLQCNFQVSATRYVSLVGRGLWQVYLAVTPVTVYL
jgi:hypothetical protein